MRVYAKSIEMNRVLARVAVVIARQDRDLMDQLRRAASSVSLNVAEGLGQRGGNRERRFDTALGSAREVRACLDVAAAWGCVAAEDPQVLEVVEHVIGMLVRLVSSRRR